MDPTNHSLRRLSLHLLMALAFGVCANGAIAQDLKHTLESWLKPAPLKAGDTIALVAPAGPADRQPIIEYRAQLEREGFHVSVDPSMFDRRDRYLAGTDDQRLEEINRAIKDRKVRAIFPVRGGFGLTRILDRIDYESLRNDPKIITGYSDLTALHLAISKKVSMVTFHSPMPLSNLWKSSLPENTFALQSFRKMIFFDSYRLGVVGSTVTVPQGASLETVVGGKGSGRLLGGNLSLVTSTLGTPFAIDPQGAILFLEDIHEAPYRVDRMLSQLRLAGVLSSIRGLIFGGFTTKDPEEEREIERVLREYARELKVPVLMHFPVGHIRNNATLPHGALVELDADAQVLRLLENPVAL